MTTATRYGGARRKLAVLLTVTTLTGSAAVLAAEAISADAYRAKKDSVASVYKADMAACKSLSGNANDVCEQEAKVKREVALAENEAAYKNTPKARYDARVARAEGAYEVAKERCDDLSGNAKDVCLKEAKAVETRAKAEAKVDRVASESSADAVRQTAEAQREARDDTRDAQYRVALEKCDTLAGAAKDACVNQAKQRHGRT